MAVLQVVAVEAGRMLSALVRIEVFEVCEKLDLSLAILYVSIYTIERLR
jgi:hypothetical protein